MIFFLNGKFVPEEKAMVSVKDHGFLYGDGVYETLRTYHGNVWNVKAHVDRLFRSAREIKIDMPWKKEEVCFWIEETVRRNFLTLARSQSEVPDRERSLRSLPVRNDKGVRDDREYRIRVTMSRGMNHFDFVTAKKPTLCIAVERLMPEPTKVYEKGVSVITFPLERTLPEAKSLNFLPAILARQAMAKKRAYEALFVNHEGRVTEGTIANVCIVRDGTLITPDKGVLAGTTREIILKLAKPLMRLHLRDITKNELYTADECFLSNTIRGIVPVTRIDGKKIGNGRPGMWTKRLLTLFLDIIFTS